MLLISINRRLGTWAYIFLSNREVPSYGCAHFLHVLKDHLKAAWRKLWALEKEEKFAFSVFVVTVISVFGSHGAGCLNLVWLSIAVASGHALFRFKKRYCSARGPVKALWSLGHS